MKTDFTQPRFTGARFDEHTLPVDVARDLAAYANLIVELAKHLYLKAHPERQRVLKGFASSFRLDIERIDDGSTSPMLALVRPHALALTGGEQDCFTQARDLIAECIAAPANTLPTDFPKGLLAHFNSLGRSLREDESLELPRRGVSAPARLTPEVRRRLVLAANRVYEREISLNGYVEEVDFAKSTFRLNLADGGTVIVPMPDSFENDARVLLGRPRHHVNVVSVGAYDSWERLQKVVSVESIDVIKNHAISARLDEIAEIQDGWFEGGGVAPNADRLELVSESLIADYPDSLALPQIVPMQDGNLLMEWKVEGDPSLDIDLDELRASFHAFTPRGADIEHDFDLNAHRGWQSLFAYLGDHIKAAQE